MIFRHYFIRTEVTLTEGRVARDWRLLEVFIFVPVAKVYNEGINAIAKDYGISEKLVCVKSFNRV